MEKWVNWKTILTSLASLIIIGLLTAGYNGVSAEYGEYKQMKVAVAEQSQQMKQMQEQTIILRRMSEDVAGIKRTILTVTGKGVVRDFGQNACIRINTSGKASSYATMEKARITNLTSTEMPSIVVRIEGTFIRADENELAVISKHAGGLLDARPGALLNIRIEPAEK